MSVSKQTVQAFIDGQEDATAKVYDEYKNLMYFIIASYISIPEDCEDVLSEAFIKAMDHRTDIKDPSNIKSFLASIARNTALDFIKKNKEYNAMLNLLEPLLTNKETIVTYYRAVFSYSWKEIVEETGIPESTARAIYASAKEKLRRELR